MRALREIEAYFAILISPDRAGQGESHFLPIAPDYAGITEKRMARPAPKLVSRMESNRNVVTVPSLLDGADVRYRTLLWKIYIPFLRPGEHIEFKCQYGKLLFRNAINCKPVRQYSAHWLPLKRDLQSPSSRISS